MGSESDAESIVEISDDEPEDVTRKFLMGPNLLNPIWKDRIRPCPVVCDVWDCHRSSFADHHRNQFVPGCRRNGITRPSQMISFISQIVPRKFTESFAQTFPPHNLKT